MGGYCEDIGARLPSKEEFTRLGGYLGSGSDQGYSHHDNQILPNLADYWFWSSSVNPNYPNYFCDFTGSDGVIDYDYRSFSYAVRCVVAR
ncbi:MAG: hypothetical protein AAB309_03990 [Deltaproteobacteria bacterium]